MLHLVSLLNVNSTLLAGVSAGDAMVLLDDAVYNCLRGSRAAELLAGIVSSSRCYVLAEHLEPRGIVASEVLAGIEIIDYPALVHLTVAHTTIYTWA